MVSAKAVLARVLDVDKFSYHHNNQYADDSNVDYENLFCNSKKGHLTKYCYASSIDYFELLISNEKCYYIPHLESTIINNNIRSISKLLGKHVNLVDVGPGPEYSIVAKVKPFIHGLIEPASYTALDLHLNYARYASSIVQKHFPNLTTYTQQIDCNHPYNLSLDGKVSMLFFGNTIGNLDDETLNIVFKNFYYALKQNDLLVFTVDCNMNVESIKNAYNNYWMYKLALATMYYFENSFRISGFNAQNFTAEYHWHHASKAVHMNVVALKEQNFVFNGNTIHIPKGKKYHVITSRKFTPEFIDERVTEHGFKIRGKFSDPDRRVFLYVLQK